MTVSQKYIIVGKELLHKGQDRDDATMGKVRSLRLVKPISLFNTEALTVNTISCQRRIDSGTNIIPRRIWSAMNSYEISVDRCAGEEIDTYQISDSTKVDHSPGHSAWQ